MGRKIDALLRRGFKASKFNTLAKLAISRLATIKNQHQVRSANARFDVIQLLKLGYQDRALLRVEYVIKEHNMLDVFVMIEEFIHLLTERLDLLQDINKECPEEIEEAISSLIFAATRCGEFPELKRIRDVFTSRFGKDFVSSAAQLRNNCKVNFKMIQKLLTRQPTLEQRLKVLNEIAYENGITLQLEDVQPAQKQTTSYESAHLSKGEARDEIKNTTEKLSESTKARKFEGIANAAQEAYVELSRADLQDSDQEETNNSAYDESRSDKMDPKDNSSSETEIERTISFSSNDSDKDTKMEPNLPLLSEPFSEDEATEIKEIPYETPKAEVESSDNPRFESSQSFSDFGQELHAQQVSDRKLMSVRTVPVLRS